MVVKNKPRGFVISWDFPPKNSSESLVTYKLLKNSQYNYDVWTFFGEEQSEWVRNQSEKQLTAGNVHVLKNSAKNLEEWRKKAVEYFNKNAQKYDFIMSRSMPAECHDLALEINNAFPGIKWVASFSDPIVDNPFLRQYSNKDNPFSIISALKNTQKNPVNILRVFLSPKRRKKAKKWQEDFLGKNSYSRYLEKINQQIFEEADKIILNNPLQAERAKKHKVAKNNAHKIAIIPHAYDLGLYCVEKKDEEVSLKEPNAPLHFVYVGFLDDIRTAQTLIKALAILNNERDDLSQKIKIDFYGKLDHLSDALIKKYNLGKIVKIHGNISYLQSLQIIKESDWGILIDADLSKITKKYYFFPAKTVDYLGAKLPILAITQKQSVVSDIIGRIGSGVVVPHKPKKIAEALENIINDKITIEYNELERSKYSGSSVGTSLDEILSKILK